MTHSPDQFERFGVGGVYDRELFHIDIPHLGLIPIDFTLPGPHFACLVAVDAQVVQMDEIAAFAKSLLASGAVYVCTWGPDCERVHDIFDEVIGGGGPEVPRFDDEIMTTWHDGVGLDEALWFLLSCSMPDDSYADTCGSALVITVNHKGWRQIVKSALSDSEAFCRKVCANQKTGDQV